MSASILLEIVGNMELAKKCIGCGISFENWVSGKIMNHVSNCKKIRMVDGVIMKKYEEPRIGYSPRSQDNSEVGKT